MEIPGKDHPDLLFWGMDDRKDTSLLGLRPLRSPDPCAAPSTAIKAPGVQPSPPPCEGVESSDRNPLPEEGSSKKKSHHPPSQSQRCGKREGGERVFPYDRKGKPEREVDPLGG